jgi:beta-hydroxylase
LRRFRGLKITLVDAMMPPALHDPSRFSFVPTLEAAFAAIRAELLALDAAAFVESPDSLSTAEGGYDERGWHWFALAGGDCEANRARCPATAAALAAVPGLVNAGFSRFAPGTHLYPHRGEMVGVLRCHLPLLVPPGRVGMGFGEAVVTWKEGRCLVFDDTFEHEAWNHADRDRVVLLATFAWPAEGAQPPTR